jgi:DNA repair photolyase
MLLICATSVPHISKLKTNGKISIQYVVTVYIDRNIKNNEKQASKKKKRLLKKWATKQVKNGYATF